MSSGFLVELRLEIMLVLDSFRASGGGPRVDTVEPALQLRQRIPSVLAEYERDSACPPPRCHIDDGVFGAKQILFVSDLCVENAIVASGFEQVAFDGVVNTLRRMMSEVHRLARVGTDTRGNEHQPRQQLTSGL